MQGKIYIVKVVEDVDSNVNVTAHLQYLLWICSKITVISGTNIARICQHTFNVYSVG